MQPQDVNGMIERLNTSLKAFPEGHDSLDFALESAAKHIPAYLKIVKSHIEQLAKVLDLESHNHRNLDSVGLAEPVIQLMQLFRELKEEDIQLIEVLAENACNWATSEELETDRVLEAEV